MSSDGGISYERIGGTRISDEDDDSFIDPFAVEAQRGASASFAPLPDMRSGGGGGGGGSGSSGSSGSGAQDGAGGGGGGGSGSGSGRAGRAAVAPLDAFQLGSDLALSASLGGAGAGAGASLLVHERRGLWGQASFNAGYSYAYGLAIGGAFGVLHGLRSAPNRQPRILLNAVLNSCGRFGARAGNAMGVFAMVFTVVERQMEDAELDRLPARLAEAARVDALQRQLPFDLPRLPALPGGFLMPAAFATGVAFCVPRAITMRGVERAHVSLPKRLAVLVIGGVAGAVAVGALAAVGPSVPVVGARAPFRFGY